MSKHASVGRSVCANDKVESRSMFQRVMMGDGSGEVSRSSCSKREVRNFSESAVNP